MRHRWACTQEDPAVIQELGWNASATIVTHTGYELLHDPHSKGRGLYGTRTSQYGLDRILSATLIRARAYKRLSGELAIDGAVGAPPFDEVHVARQDGSPRDLKTQ